jgi:hypothetical protein
MSKVEKFCETVLDRRCEFRIGGLRFLQLNITEGSGYEYQPLRIRGDNKQHLHLQLVDLFLRYAELRRLRRFVLDSDFLGPWMNPDMWDPEELEEMHASWELNPVQQRDKLIIELAAYNLIKVGLLGKHEIMSALKYYHDETCDPQDARLCEQNLRFMFRRRRPEVSQLHPPTS